jgi:hypothetical protein
MTVEEVQSLVSLHAAEALSTVNDHRIALKQSIIPPHRISVTWRKVENGNLKDELINVWLVGQENLNDGYKIILRDDGKQFGLASNGYPNDRYPILVGWYGSLLSAFMAM